MRIHSVSQNRRLEERLMWLNWIRRLCRHVSKRRVSRFCDRFFYLGKARRSVKLITPYHRNLLLHADTDSWLERWVLNQGCYEPEVIDCMERCLRPDMVAFDVGANIGCHTLIMADAVKSTGRVVAFEPNPAMRERLRANLALNRFTHVDVVPLCVSDHVGRHTLFAPLGDEYNQGLASMHRENLGQHCREIATTTVTIDDFVHDHRFQRLDLIKIDVEGHEYPVLAGARETLRLFQPALLFEFSQRQWANAGVAPEVVEKFLTDLGYALFVLRESAITRVDHGVPEECNLLGVPRGDGKTHFEDQTPWPAVARAMQSAFMVVEGRTETRR